MASEELALNRRKCLCNATGVIESLSLIFSEYLSSISINFFFWSLSAFGKADSGKATPDAFEKFAEAVSLHIVPTARTVVHLDS